LTLKLLHTSNLSKAHEMHDSLSSSSSQVVQVYLQLFWCNSLSKRVLQIEITKNSQKTPLLGFKVIQDHRCW